MATSETPSRPKIVVLDGYTLNPGDLSWAKLRAMGQVSIYEHSTPEEIPERAAQADVILEFAHETHRERGGVGFAKEDALQNALVVLVQKSRCNLQIRIWIPVVFQYLSAFATSENQQKYHQLHPSTQIATYTSIIGVYGRVLLENTLSLLKESSSAMNEIRIG